MRSRGVALSVLVFTGCLGLATPGWPQARQSLVIRGHQQSVYVYGNPQGDPVIVSSGDGGWIHLAPHVAQFLGSHGFFVVGFNAKSYLESFTSEHAALQPDEEPGDYRVLVEFARKATGKKPVLIGASEGAGLSVLAATDAETKAEIAGVIALGLPDLNELGWRWKDAAIYFTHAVPDEPTFSAAAIANRVAPVPLAVIHSTHDEFVPCRRGKDPRRCPRAEASLIVQASNHRFSDNVVEFDQRLLDAIEWVRKNSPRG